MTIDAVVSHVDEAHHNQDLNDVFSLWGPTQTNEVYKREQCQNTVLIHNEENHTRRTLSIT
jgi:hypothetical protein